MADSTAGVRPGKTAATCGKDRYCRQIDNLMFNFEYKSRLSVAN